MNWGTTDQKHFAVAAAGDPYLRGRWGYYRAAAELIHRAVDPDEIRPALEIGPRAFPLLLGPGANYLDVHWWGLPRTIVYDAEKTPWRFAADRCYAVAVALQVLEHLREPALVLAEMVRVAEFAVVSIPHRWTGGPPGHQGLDLDTLRRWAAPAGVVLEHRIAGSRLVGLLAQEPPP